VKEIASQLCKCRFSKW